MDNIKINMTNGNILTMHNSDNTMNVRLCSDDRQCWRFTDVHCTLNEMAMVTAALKRLGIQPGEDGEAPESNELPFPLNLLFRE